MKRKAQQGFTPPRRFAEHGFTLVELVVALFIFGMLAAAGVALLSFGVRAQAAAGNRLDDVAADRRMSVLLANDLAQALPRIARGVDGAPVRAFTGNDGRSDPLVLGYVRGGWTNPDAALRPSIQRVDVVLEAGRLERRSYPMTDGAATAVTLVLADDVVQLALRYRTAEGEWRPRWDNARLDTLPRAVELTVERRAQPALTLAFLVGTPVG